jgi:hypothetical protein
MSTGTSLTLRLCLLAAFASGCVEAVDYNDESAPSQALTAALPAARTPDHSALLDAIKTRDWGAISAAIGANHSAAGVVIAVERGPIDGYQGSAEPVVVRHSSAPDVELLVRSDLAISAALLGLDGRLHALNPEIEAVEGSDELVRMRIRQRDLVTQGLLLVGPDGADLRDLDAQTLALAIVDDRWECAPAQPRCAPGDHACILADQQPCIERDLTFLARHPLTEDTDEIQRLIDYVDLYSAVTDVHISAQPVASDRSGQWHTLNFQAPAGAQIARITAYNEGDQGPVALRWRQLDGAIQLLAPADGFQPGVVIVDTSAAEARLDALGVAPSPATEANRLLGCHTWSLSACVQVEDTLTQMGSTANRPVAGAVVRAASASILSLGIFIPWLPTTTNANGCFQSSRTFCGIGSKAKRRLRANIAFSDAKLTIRNPFAFESIFNFGLFPIYQNNSWNSEGAYSAGTLLFKPGNGAELGNTERHRQALSWYFTHKLDSAFNTQDPWLRYQSFYKIEYPHPLWGGISLPIVPPIVQLRASDWDLATLTHEIGHVWHYMHNFGLMPNVVTSLLNGWSTHNCQEDDNIAFLEGFAEFFSRQVLCGDVFHSAACYGTTPRSRNGLNNHYTCNDEQGFGLTTPGRVSLNDDGVTHALQALVVDNFYQRNFQHWSNAYAPLNPMPLLNKACQWYPYDNLNLWHVLRTFRANNAAGYTTNFPSMQGFGISQFYARFRAVNNLPLGYLQDRLRLWDAGWTYNPIDICRKPCAELSPWWTGGAHSSTLVNNDRCDIEPVPAGQTAFVEDNKYYLKQPRSCPIGGWDTANCHVLTPAPGTTPFIWNNNLYTTALPGNVCPAGGWDGANCHIGTPAPGTTPFIWNNSLYTTPLIGPCAAGILTSADHCYIGRPPVAATAQINAGNFSYPRQ